jgi:hypothetical protein
MKGHKLKNFVKVHVLQNYIYKNGSLFNLIKVPIVQLFRTSIKKFVFMDFISLQITTHYNTYIVLHT